MSLLQRMGLTPKPGRGSRRTGLRLEGRSTEDSDAPLDPRFVLERLGMFSLLAILAMLAFPNISVYDGSAEPGDVWKGQDVIAPYDFAIRLSDDELRARQDSARLQVPPVFAENDGAMAQTLARLDSVDARLDSTFQAFSDWRRALSDRAIGQAEGATQGLPSAADITADSLQYARAAAALRVSLPPQHWEHLLSSAWEKMNSASGGLSLSEVLLGETGRLSREMLARGVLNVNADSLYNDELLVRNLDPNVRTEQVLSRADVLSLDEAYAIAAQRLAETFPGKPDTVAIGVAFVRATLVPSLVYQTDATQRALGQAESAVLPSKGVVRQQYTIIRRGDVVTADRAEQLRSLQIEERERSGVTWAQTVVGRLLLVLSGITIFFLYLYLLRPGVFRDTGRMVLITLLFALVLAGFLIAGEFGGDAHLVVPVPLALILLTIAFDSRVGSFATMTVAAIGGLVFGFDFEFAFATLFVGILAVFSVRDVKNRSQLVASAGLVLAAYAVVFLGYALLRADPFSGRFVSELVSVSVNSVLILLGAPLIWGIERVFGITTDMTLLELSDTNRPLLKELSLRAPGTFNHSLQVANLAEAASDAVGANALQARVGALYHDIGKMLKPEYYIENQQPGENPHNKLKPSMSALVISAHVKDGVDLATEHKLPAMVIDFIRTHHGTSAMDYFVRKAEEQRGPDDPPVLVDDFRYPGPRPCTAEQAIVMLADSVEAASRSIEKPTPRRLETLIDSIFKARIDDKQLDETSLTFADLARIRETFHNLLCGVYHFRVKYPDQPGEGEASVPEDDSVPTPSEESSVDAALSGAESLAAKADAADEPPADPSGAPDGETSGLRRGFRERSSLG